MTRTKIKRPIKEVILRVYKVGKNKYQAWVVDGPEGAIFSSDGTTWMEAIGACVIHNRKLLGFAFLMTGDVKPTISRNCRKTTQRKMLKLIEELK